MHSLLRGGALACLVILTAFSSPTQGGASAADELAAVLRELRELRQGYYSQKDDLQARIDAERSALEHLRTDVENLEAEDDKLRADAREIRADIDAFDEELTELNAHHTALLAVIRAFAERARTHVDAGPPYRVEGRRRAIELFADAEAPREAFARLWGFVEDELRVSRSGETYSAEIDLADGRRKHARFVRVGLHVLGFVTEDGKDVGAWIEGTGWVTDPQRAAPEQVRKAVEILDRRCGPEHVALPVSLRKGD